MNHQLHHAVDAFSASAAIRLRYQFLAAKHGGAPSIVPVLPPPVEVPSQPLHQFYYGTQCVIEDRHPLAHLMRLRDEAAAEIERLLTFLDETEGLDADFELGIEDREDDSADNEPSLAAANTDERSQEHWSQGDDADHEGYDPDMEPSLCGVGVHEFQPQPDSGRRDLDLEDEHDGREDGYDTEEDRADYEPSLGWTANGECSGCLDLELNGETA